MVCFQTKNPNLGKFWRALDWKKLIYFLAIWDILWRFGKFYDHLVHFVFIWYIYSGFCIMYQEKSGNPALMPILEFHNTKISKMPKMFNSFDNPADIFPQVFCDGLAVLGWFRLG
jgi:hypothetical protein